MQGSNLLHCFNSNNTEMESILRTGRQNHVCRHVKKSNGHLIMASFFAIIYDCVVITSVDCNFNHITYDAINKCSVIFHAGNKMFTLHTLSQNFLPFYSHEDVQIDLKTVFYDDIIGD